MTLCLRGRESVCVGVFMCSFYFYFKMTVKNVSIFLYLYVTVFVTAVSAGSTQEPRAFSGERTPMASQPIFVDASLFLGKTQTGMNKSALSISQSI